MKVCDYQCRLCSEVFEIKVQDTENFPPEIECPVCKEKTAIRLYTAPSIHYNTNGFYSTDNSPIKKE